MLQSKETLWDINANVTGRQDYEYFETEDEKYFIYFSKIEEYGNQKFVSPVQIWKNKNNPEKIFHSTTIRFEYQFSRTCYYFEKSDLIGFLTPCGKSNTISLPYVLFDFSKAQFTIVNAPDFDLIEIDKNSFRQELNFRYYYDDEAKERIEKGNGKIINLERSNWFSLDKINSICLLLEQAMKEQ